jgi:uncharacterized protein (TIGR02599 family)
MSKYRNSIARQKCRHGFTLVELLVSMSILSLLMLMVASVLSEVQKAWGQTSKKVSQFREARRAFDILKVDLNQAVLNTYLRYRYDNPSDPFSPFNGSTEIKNAAPTEYVRYSELQFISGPTANVIQGKNAAQNPGHCVFFHAPIGQSSVYTHVPTALNPRGYFIAYGDDVVYRPDFLAQTRAPVKHRYRLMQFAPPTEKNVVYDEATLDNQGDWFTAASINDSSLPIADNVVLLVISPRRPVVDDTGDPRDIAPQYAYNSSIQSSAGQATNDQTSQLPPQIEVVMAVIDEISAGKLAESAGANPPLVFNGFTEANNAKFRSDLNDLERYLTDLKLNFRVFTATLALRNSKWNGIPQ